MKPFLFKRGKIYHFEYFDEEEQKIKRTSAKCNKKNDALKFLIDFQKKYLSSCYVPCNYLKSERRNCGMQF